ncbi:ribonuclease P protein component [Salinibacterium sp.]|uniref:ribonuclease P protein component n=1 Tax=Salinibacterium sp. TaxID=1915057 RepID=UPI00286D6109|nr:ribonuclease P protein component [Salinibacterium sp.]
MLARANRVTKPADFRTVVRSGRRVVSPNVVVYVLSRVTIGPDRVGPSRCGFIVTKAVGNAVIRNTVRRRLREACRAVLPTLNGSTDIVIRALPGSPEVAWATLQAELTESINRGVMKR